jgi:hypothetical protein
MQYTLFNKAPTATPVQAGGQSPTGVVTGDLNARGMPGAILAYSVSQNPSRGNVTVNPDGTYAYTPTNTFAESGGTDEFAVTIDGSSAFRLTGMAGLLQAMVHSVAQILGMSGSDSTQVAVGVLIAARNQSPVALADVFTTVEDVAVVGDVLGNDTDPEGNSLTAVVASGPAHGSVSLSPGGSFTYTPVTGFHGFDTFTYTVSDGQAVSVPAPVTLTITASTSEPAVPTHVALAEQMVNEIAPNNNSYTNGRPTVRFAGINGATAMYNASDCSSFVTQLLQASYNFSDAMFTSWTGEADPEAEDYYTAAEAHRGFIAFSNVHSVDSGDLFIIKYTGAQKDTGHMVVITAPPIYVGDSSRAGMEGLRVYRLPILDVTGSPHGSSDSRYATDQDGIGIGYMRLYTDSDGNLITYQWNDYANGIIYSSTDRLPTFAKVTALQPNNA